MNKTRTTPLFTTMLLCTALTASANNLNNAELWYAAPNSLTPVDAYLDDRFGHALATDGSWAVIGAPRDDEQGAEAGAAYVYAFQNGRWQSVEKLLASDGESGDSFGYSVSIDGDTAVVGTVFDDDLGTDAGAAYVFQFDGVSWLQTAKLTAEDGQSLDFFGISVSQANDRILVGANHHDAAANSGGSAFVFERLNGNWTQTARLNASDSGVGDQFGFTVSLSGDRALIGAHRNRVDGVATGAAYVYERQPGGWQETAKLIAPDGEHDDRFGIAVSLDGSQALIGANGRQNRQGGALIFQLNDFGWTHASTLEAASGEAYDRFGTAVSLQDGVALVGAPYAQQANTGAVYEFHGKHRQWQQSQQHNPHNIGEVLFGQSVARSGHRIIMGATGLDAHPSGAGTVYVINQKAGLSAW